MQVTGGKTQKEKQVEGSTFLQTELEVIRMEEEGRPEEEARLRRKKDQLV